MGGLGTGGPTPEGHPCAKAITWVKDEGVKVARVKDEGKGGEIHCVFVMRWSCWSFSLLLFVAY